MGHKTNLNQWNPSISNQPNRSKAHLCRLCRLCQRQTHSNETVGSPRPAPCVISMPSFSAGSSHLPDVARRWNIQTKTSFVGVEVANSTTGEPRKQIGPGAACPMDQAKKSLPGLRRHLRHNPGSKESNRRKPLSEQSPWQAVGNAPLPTTTYPAFANP